MKPIFIGHTGLIELTLRRKSAGLLQRITENETVDVTERRWLFTGPPGVAKSELAAHLALNFAGVAVPPGASALRMVAGGAAPWAIEYRNGARVSAEVVRDWCQRDCYRPLDGVVAVHLLDEVDAITPTAMTDMRTFLDCLANHRIVIATTNRPVNQLQEQLQSRFKIFQFEPIAEDAITHLLMDRFPLDFDSAGSIAAKVGGNVRAALADADTQMDILAASEDFAAVAA